jgi:hypothetical protein
MLSTIWWNTPGNPDGLRTPARRDVVQLKEDGYIESKNLQPVQNILNDPVMNVGTSGHMAEITVPFTTAVVDQKDNHNNNSENQMFFYGSTHWIYGLGKDKSGTLYYRVKEDRWDDSYYVNAAHMRLIPDEELTPISPDVDQSRKIIRIDLQDNIW